MLLNVNSETSETKNIMWILLCCSLLNQMAPGSIAAFIIQLNKNPPCWCLSPLHRCQHEVSWQPVWGQSHQQEVLEGQRVASSLPRPLPPRLLPLGVPQVEGLQPTPCHPQRAAGQHHQGGGSAWPAMMRRATLDERARAAKCIAAGGGHFEK